MPPHVGLPVFYQRCDISLHVALAEQRTVFLCLRLPLLSAWTINDARTVDKAAQNSRAYPGS